RRGHHAARPLQRAAPVVLAQRALLAMLALARRAARAIRLTVSETRAVVAARAIGGLAGHALAELARDTTPLLLACRSIGAIRIGRHHAPSFVRHAGVRLHLAI